MNIEWLMANGDIGEVTSTYLPDTTPPGGASFVFEHLHLADAVTEGILLRKRAFYYDTTDARALVSDLDSEPSVIIKKSEIPSLLQLDVNGKCRLARIVLDENGDPKLSTKGMLTFMQLPENNVLDADILQPTERESPEMNDYFELSEILGAEE